MRFNSSSTGNKRSKGGGVIAAIVFIALAIGLNYVTSDMITEAKESENWPSVYGVVTSSEISSYVDRDDGKNQTMYRAEISTAYTVDGNAYSTSSINLAGQSSTSSRNSVQKKINQYPTGQEVPVYYDPDKPDHAILEPGMPFIFRILKIVPLILVIAAVLIIIKTILKIAGLVTALGFLAAKKEKKPVTGHTPPTEPAANLHESPPQARIPAAQKDTKVNTENKYNDDTEDGFSI